MDGVETLILTNLTISENFEHTLQLASKEIWKLS
jgi:hypothetical protein